VTDLRWPALSVTYLLIVVGLTTGLWPLTVVALVIIIALILISS
jgi:hypothetical protein